MFETDPKVELAKLTDPNPTLADLVSANYAATTSPYDENADVGFL